MSEFDTLSSMFSNGNETTTTSMLWNTTTDSTIGQQVRYVTVPLTDTQEKILSLLPIPACLISIMGSATIIYMACNARRNTKQQPSSSSSPSSTWTPYTRLLIGLSANDIIFSFGFIFWSFLLPKDTSHRIWAIGNDTTCSTIGFLAQLSSSTMLYNGMLSFYFVLSARYGYSNQQIATTWYIEPLMHIISFGYPLVTASVGSILGVYKEYELGLGCWVKEYPDGCGTGPGQVPCKSIWIAYLFGAVTLVFSFGSIVINNTVIWNFVRQQTQMKQQLQQSNKSSMQTTSGTTRTSNTNSAITTTTTNNKNNNQEQQRVQLLNVASLTSSATTTKSAPPPQQQPGSPTTLSSLPQYQNYNNEEKDSFSSDGDENIEESLKDVTSGAVSVVSSNPTEQSSKKHRSTTSSSLDIDTNMNGTVGAVVLGSYFSDDEDQDEDDFDDDDDVEQQKQEHYRRTTSQPYTTTKTTATHEQQQQQQLKRLHLVSSQALLYVGAFFICTTWTLIVKVLESIRYSNEQQLFPLLALQAWFFPLQGFFNFFVYVRPKYLKWRHSYPEESKLWSLQQAMMIGGWGRPLGTTTVKPPPPPPPGTAVAVGGAGTETAVAARGVDRDSMTRRQRLLARAAAARAAAARTAARVKSQPVLDESHQNSPLPPKSYNPSQATTASSHKTGKILLLPGKEEEDEHLTGSSFWDTMGHNVQKYNDSCGVLLTPQRPSTSSAPESSPTVAAAAAAAAAAAKASQELREVQPLSLLPLPPRRLPRNLISSITNFSSEEEEDEDIMSCHQGEDYHQEKEHVLPKINDEWTPPPLQPLQIPDHHHSTIESSFEEEQEMDKKEQSHQSNGDDDDDDGSDSSSTYEEPLQSIVRQERLKGGEDEDDEDEDEKKDKDKRSSSSSAWKWPSRRKLSKKSKQKMTQRRSTTSSLEMISELSVSIFDQEDEEEDVDEDEEHNSIHNTIDDGDMSIQSETSSMKRVRFRGMEKEVEAAAAAAEEQFSPPQRRWSASGCGISQPSRPTYSPRKRSPSAFITAAAGGSGLMKVGVDLSFDRMKEAIAPLPMDGPIQRPTRRTSTTRLQQQPTDVPIQRPMRQLSTTPDVPTMDTPIQRPMRQLSTEPRYNIPQQRNGSSGEFTMVSSIMSSSSSISISLESDSSIAQTV